MQVAAALPRHWPHRFLPSSITGQMRFGMITCCGVLALASSANMHAANNVLPVDSQMISTLTMRAQQASPREQVQLYADLADKITVLASRQIADGDEEHAMETLHQLEDCTTQIESGLQRDSKGLKKTELLLHETNRRLSEMVRSASGDLKPMVQSALKRLDKAQSVLLSAVFQQ